MVEVLESNPWLIVTLAVLAIPVLGIVLGFWTALLAHLGRNRALRTLEAFAQNGREPPAELLRAVAGRRGRHHHHHDARHDRPHDHRVDVNVSPEAAQVVQNIAEEARTEWREALQRRRRNTPLRSWRRAVMLAALAGGFYVGSLYATLETTRSGLMIAAVIIGFIAAASTISALLTTIFREK